MKIKKIAAIVNSRKKLYLYHGKDAQWVGTGDAMYPIYNLPHMDVNQFSKLLDVPQETQAKQKYFLRELDPGTLDYVADDLPSAEPLDINRWIFKGANDYIPLCTSQGLMFLDPKFLDPIDNLDMCTVNECYNEDADHHYILVKEGMFVAAVIEPSSHVLDKQVPDELSKMLFTIQIGAYADMVDWLKRNSPDAPDEEESDDEQAALEGRPQQLLLGAPAEPEEDAGADQQPTTEDEVNCDNCAWKDGGPTGSVFPCPKCGPDEQGRPSMFVHKDYLGDQQAEEQPEPAPSPDNSQYMPEVCQRCRWGAQAPEEGEDPCTTCKFEDGEEPPNFEPREEAQAG